MLKITADEAGHLSIREVGFRSTATLTFRTDGLRLDAPGKLSADLAWDDYRKPNGNARDRSQSGWTIEHCYDYPRVGLIGVSIRAWGAAGSSCRGVRNATVRGGRRLLLATCQPGRRIPIRISMASGENYLEHRATRERTTLAHLAWALRDRSDLRDRLADPSRSSALAAEMTGGLQLAPLHERRSWSKDEAVVLAAMRALGYRHRFGRPLSADEVCPTDEVVERTAAAMVATHGASARVSQRSWINAVAAVAYIDVAPWPFASLADN